MLFAYAHSAVDSVQCCSISARSDKFVVSCNLIHQADEGRQLSSPPLGGELAAGCQTLEQRRQKALACPERTVSLEVRLANTAISTATVLQLRMSLPRFPVSPVATLDDLARHKQASELLQISTSRTSDLQTKTVFARLLSVVPSRRIQHVARRSQGGFRRVKKLFHT